MTFAFTITEQAVFNGVVRGMVYGLVALGLVLIFRASGVVNFAQGQIGAFGASAMAVLFANEGLPYYVTFPLAIFTGVLLGALTELLVVRRLFNQPRLLLFVATIGVSQVVLFLQLQLPTIDRDVAFPTPITNIWTIGNLSVRGEHLVVLVVVPALVGVLAFLLQRTRFGLAVRTAADRPANASLSGIRVKAVSTQVWAIAGALAALTALIAGPVLNQRTSEVSVALGPDLLLRGLAAALVGGMVSFPLALVGGVVIGVVEMLVLINNPSTPGTDTLVMFVLLVVLVLLRARAQGRDESAWSLAPRSRAGATELLRHPMARGTRYLSVATLLALGLVLPQLVTEPSRLNEYAYILVFLMVAVSATILTGWAGQISLGQFAFVAIGAYFTAYYGQSLGFVPSIALGVVWGVGVAVVIGIPALRVRGLYLAIITLGFALAVSNYVILLPRFNTSFTGFGSRLEPPIIKIPGIGEWDLASDKQAYYYLCFICLLGVILLVSHLRRTGIGRSLLAVRDNDQNAAAYTVSPTRMKLVAFAVSGGIAAFAGGLFAARNSTMIPDFFTPGESIRVLAVSVVGGLSSVTGAVLGTLVIVGLPIVFNDTPQLRLFGSGIGMLILLLYLPGGLVSVVDSARHQLLALLARRTGWTPRAGRATDGVARLSTRSARPEVDAAAPLRIDDVKVRFGGLLAVGGASLEVRPREVVGLIGTNGAGKTTLMNAVSGFVRATGHVEVFGTAIDAMPAHRRARHGMGRAFQNARIFGGLTVRETIMVALEARQRSLLLPSMLALPPSPIVERHKRSQADEIIAYLGLGRYADTLVAELSTGTRRIVELGALLALDTRLMLLDEPTAGVAQRETEAFGPLIKTIQQELGSAVLIIEHDMPMVMSISDRIYCLEAGAVIAQGSPAEVRANPAVIASYLGTDERAIRRSGLAADERLESDTGVDHSSRA
ncbi:MAG: ATP-binding cassette domain-containing protein [Actinobacteria bacterium]|nr:ATP-binding cassette domain-containing protein [Actinomycetota bacterium]